MVKYFLVFIFIINFYLPNLSFSKENLENRIGFRYGWSLFLEINDIDSYELYYLRHLPWIFYNNELFKINTNLNISGGLIRQDDDSDYFGTFSSNLVLTSINNKASADIGGGIALISDDRVGEHNFGGTFQFNFNWGISYNKIFKNLGIGYRFYHLSDAGIFDGRGLNRNLIEIFFEF